MLKKSCVTCKHADFGVCSNCVGVDGVTEITENYLCSNWEEATDKECLHGQINKP